jgi:hypothetical protein
LIHCENQPNNGCKAREKEKNVGGKGIKKEKKIIMEFEDTRGF